MSFDWKTIKTNNSFLLELLGEIRKNAIDPDISFKECRVRSNLMVAKHKLIPYTGKGLPSCASIGSLYLYNQEGSFITCYTMPTIQTTYPDCPYKYPGVVRTTIHLDIISRMHHPTFMFYLDWIKQNDPSFKLVHQSEFEFNIHSDFQKFINVAIKDGFEIYVKK
jgi:hypothetical protein